MAKEYWWCHVGPIERDKVPAGGDFPMRMAVYDAYENMFNETPHVTSSGWGMSERKKELISAISLYDESILEMVLDAIRSYNPND